MKVSIKKNNKRIDKKTRNLLMYSHSTRSFPWLYKIIKNNESITYGLVETLPTKQQIFFENTLDELIAKCVSEWRADHEKPVAILSDDKPRIRCSLCGTPNKKIYYIVNVHNSRVKKNVGSECATKFDFNLDVNGKTGQQLLKEEEQLKRLDEIDVRIPGIKRTIENWNLILDSYPILIPNHLTAPFIKYGETAQTILSNYIKNGKEKDLENTYSLLLGLISRRNEEIDYFKKYVKENQNKKFIISRGIVHWLKQHKEVELLNNLANHGEITLDTAGKIYESEFMGLIKSELNMILKPANLKITKADPDQKGYIFVLKTHSNVKLFGRHTDFINIYGKYLFNPESTEKITADAIISKCKPYEEKDFEPLIQYMENIIDGQAFKIIRYRIKMDEIYLLDEEENLYFKTTIRHFIGTLKSLILVNPDKDITALKTYINNLKRQGKGLSEEAYKRKSESVKMGR